MSNEDDPERRLSWSMDGECPPEDLRRLLSTLSAWEPGDDDPRRPVTRQKSQIIDVTEQAPFTEHGPLCTARRRVATVDHGSRVYREGLAHTARQLGLDVADLIAADAEIYG